MTCQELFCFVWTCCHSVCSWFRWWVHLVNLNSEIAPPLLCAPHDTMYLPTPPPTVFLMAARLHGCWQVVVRLFSTSPSVNVSFCEALGRFLWLGFSPRPLPSLCRVVRLSASSRAFELPCPSRSVQCQLNLGTRLNANAASTFTPPCNLRPCFVFGCCRRDSLRYQCCPSHWFAVFALTGAADTAQAVGPCNAAVLRPCRSQSRLVSGFEEHLAPWSAPRLDHHRMGHHGLGHHAAGRWRRRAGTASS